jgi:hypothetical protein
VFAALLDEADGGAFVIGPADDSLGTQRYLDNTNVLETRFTTPEGSFRVIDFAPRFMQHERSFRPTKIVRIVEPLDGTPLVKVRCDPRLGFSKRVAFDLSARVFRSGGFAKDAIYLKGFRAVVDRVATGASLDEFWLGKIAPEHVDAIEELLLRGLLHAPVFVPDFLERDDSKSRIARLREGLAFDRLLDPE